MNELVGKERIAAVAASAAASEAAGTGLACDTAVELTWPSEKHVKAVTFSRRYGRLVIGCRGFNVRRLWRRGPPPLEPDAVFISPDSIR